MERLKHFCQFGAAFSLALFLSVRALAQSWTAQSIPWNYWQCVASSADGVVLAAGAKNGAFYISTNSGVAWSPAGLPSWQWHWIAMSADGAHIFAVPGSNAPSYATVYSSADTGKTWSSNSEPVTWWGAIACSASGTTVAVTGLDWYGNGHMYLSTNSGVSWSPTGVSNSVGTSVACSADGSTIVAVSRGGGWMFSTNGGAAWALYSTNVQWYSVCISADGSRAVACNNSYYSGVAVSTNLAGKWTFYSAPPIGPTPLAASWNCSNLVTAISGGAIYTSTNGGANWTVANVFPLQWSSVGSSADGSKLVAVSLDGGVFSFKAIPKLAIANAGGRVVLTWSASGMDYALQTSRDPTQGWTTLTNSCAMVNGQCQITLPVSGPSGFYRLQGP